MIYFLIGVGLLAFAGALLWSGRQTQRKVSLLRKSAPARAAEVANAFPGEMVSLSGTARSDHELFSAHGRQPCIYFESSIVREYEINRRKASDRRRGSETVHSFQESIPFFVEDESGRVRVIPGGAEFDAWESLNRYEPVEQQQDSISFGGTNVNLSKDSQTIGHRYVEQTIPIDAPVFVLGVVDENGYICRPAPGRNRAGFFISYRDEAGLRRYWEQESRKHVYGAIASALAGMVVLVGIVVTSNL